MLARIAPAWPLRRQTLLLALLAAPFAASPGHATRVALGGCTLPGFDAPVAYSAGLDPAAVQALDVNGDGHLDLIVADAGSDALVVLLNDGAGAFTLDAPWPLASGAEPVALAAGTFSGGRDLAVVERGSHQVRWLDADGGPALAVALPAGFTRAGAAAAADLDGVGGDDLVVVLEGDLFVRSGGVVLLLDDGVAPPVAQVVAAPPDGFERPTHVALADLDGDGDLDLVVLRRRAAGSPSGVEAVLVWAGDGAGTFTFAGALATGEPVVALTAADMDGDGRAEIVAALDPFPGAGGSSLWVLAHDGSPTLAPAAFTTTRVAAAGTWPVAVAAGDLGDDGVPGFFADMDVVVAQFASAEVVLHESWAPGLGTFSATATCAFGGVPVALDLVDLDGDGVLDLVVLDGATAEVQVALAIAPALSQLIGVGCAGTNGLVPAIGAVGLPVHGNAAFAVTLAQARPFAPAYLAVAPALAPLPIGFGCTWYGGALLPLLPTSTSATGTASIPFPIPPAGVPYTGLDLVLQFAVLDPFGSFLGTYSLSNALRLQLGH